MNTAAKSTGVGVTLEVTRNAKGDGPSPHTCSLSEQGPQPGKVATLHIVGLSADHPTHPCNTITDGGAQANDVQSECRSSTSVPETKTPDARDP
jgi:hypothetical protein